MCIDEVKSLYDNLKKCGQVFLFSLKKEKIFDQAIGMLEMREKVHLISWCHSCHKRNMCLACTNIAHANQ